MKTSLERWLFGALLLVILAMGATNIYIADVNQRQAHTIRQLMGWELGPDATPQPPKAIIPPPVLPEPPSQRPENTYYDWRRLQRTI
jgi:hypothetical protein